MDDEALFVALLQDHSYLIAKVLSEDENNFALTNVVRVVIGDNGPKYITDAFFKGNQPCFLNKDSVLLWRPLHPEYDQELLGRAYFTPV